MAGRVDPYRQLRFILEIGGVAKAGFSRCDLPAATSPVIEYREGNELPTPRKLPGLNEYGPLVLETGITDRSIELFEWRQLVEQGAMEEARRPVAVSLLDATGLPAARWEFREAWPSHYEAPRLSATADEVAIERLVVVNEGFGRVDVEVGSPEEADGGDEPVVGLPTGDLPRVDWTPQGIGGSPRKTRRSADETGEESGEP